MKIVWAFLPVAVPIEKRPRQNIAGRMLHLLPHSSDIGAQHRGPKANPRLLVAISVTEHRDPGKWWSYMYSEIHRTVTSELTPMASEISLSAGDMILDPILAASANIPSWNVNQDLYPLDQFLGLSLSFSSQSTKFGSFSFSAGALSSSLGGVFDHCRSASGSCV
jgi:hypothetical protein